MESYPNDGLISQGGAGYEENALKLFQNYQNASKAKFAVLFPL